MGISPVAAAEAHGRVPDLLSTLRDPGDDDALRQVVTPYLVETDEPRPLPLPATAVAVTDLWPAREPWLLLVGEPGSGKSVERCSGPSTSVASRKL